jgi:phenylacetate-CoA ligase
MSTEQYWEKQIELMPREELHQWQLKQLNQTITQASRSPYYKQVFAKHEIKAVKSLDDLRKIPFTVKDDLRNHFPYGFLTTDLSEVVRLHSSSGTTGNPTVVYHTAADIKAWRNMIARCMYMAGARKTDVFQNMMGYGLFTGGLGFHYGAEELGMMTIPVGPGNSKRQVWFMQQFKTSVVHILPSYALRLAGLMGELGVDPKKDLNIRLAFIGAEPHSEEVRRKIEQLLGIKAFNSYGLSEMCGPGVAFECEHQQGLHLWEDQFLAEIIDPQTGKRLPAGEEGELVLTTLNRQAMPLIRYRTRDLTRLIDKPCPCGRTHQRIDRIKGRSDDMLIINGVNLYPIQIEEVLMRFPEIGTNYVIFVEKENFMDKLIIKVELKEEAFGGTLKELEILQGKIRDELQSEITVNPVVKLVEANSLPVQEGKAVRVFDYREKL